MNKFFCPAPWRSIYSHVNKTAVCCVSSTQLDLKPVEFLQSDYLKNLKQKFLNNEPDETCTICRSLEQKGLQSIRHYMLDRFGESTEERIDYMELRASNLCNFECIMCNSQNSSVIANQVNTVSGEHWSEIMMLAEKVDFLILTGGEPMLIKHYYELLDHLIEKNRTDMKLRVYTNASVYNPQFVSKMIKFDALLNLSIDGIGTIAETQRRGTVWSVVDANVREYLRLPMSIKFHATLTSVTIVGVEWLVRYFIEMKNINPRCDFTIHTAMRPQSLSIVNMKQDKDKAIDSVKRALELVGKPEFTQIRNQLHSCLSILNS